MLTRIPARCGPINSKAARTSWLLELKTDEFQLFEFNKWTIILKSYNLLTRLKFTWSLFILSMFSWSISLVLCSCGPSSPVDHGIEGTLHFGQDFLHWDEPSLFFQLTLCIISQLKRSKEKLDSRSYSLGVTILMSSCSITMSVPIVPTSYSKPFAISSSL